MFKKNNFIKNVIGFSIPTWISFAISFISTPIITRLFQPSEIGKINLFSTFLNLFLLIVYFGLDQAYVRFYKELPGKYTKNELFTFSLGFSLFIGIIISTIILIFSKFFSIQISGTNNFIISTCLSLSIIANIVLKFLNVYSRVEQNIILYSIQAIAIALISKVFYVIVALWNPTHENAIIALTIGYIIIAILFLSIKGDVISIAGYFDKKSVVTLLKFGIPLIPVTILSWLNNSIPQFMLKTFVDYSAIGIYTNAVAIANTMNLIQTGFSLYWIPYVYANYKTHQETIKKVHSYITFIMCALGITLILIQDVIYLLLGSNYRSSKNFFPFLIISPICFTIAETTGVGIGISKKSYLNIISFLSCTLTNLVVSFLLISSIGIEGAAISTSISAVILLVVKTCLGEKYYKCASNYFKTIFSLIIVFADAFINYYYFDENSIKYPLIIISLILLIIINKDILYELNILFKERKSK